MAAGVALKTPPFVTTFLCLVACSGSGESRIPPADPCALAWRELSEFRAAMEAVTGDSVSSPSEARFIETCRGTPEAARPCMSARYFLDHYDACTQVMARLPADDRRRITDSLSSPRELDAGSPSH